jgi:RNA polymerase sigma factor (sigma-70 family)
MNDWTDVRLLREYSERGSEGAFTTLVSRHLAMVYHAALRQTRQPELAEEVVQTVFTLLARKAGRISARTTLSGWLFNSTRFVSTRAVRDEFRRHRREKEAALMNLNSSPPETSEQAERVLPLLDGVLARLSNTDREALLMRYFEGKPFLQVAAAMGSTEEATRKRVQRALDKLRGMLGAHGAVLGSATVALVLQATASQAAPAGLSAAGVSSAALAGAMGATTLSVLTQTTLEIMKWTQIKIAAAAIAAVLAAGTTAYCVDHNKTFTPVVQGTNAVIPYKTMDDFCQMADSVDQNKLLARAIVTSKRAVPPADISFTIQSAAKGPIPVGLGTNGEVLNFPHEEELRRENPPIIANQPKGTLYLFLSARIDMPEGLTFNYHRMGDGIAEVNKLIKTQAGILSPLAPKVRGVIFIFPKSSAGKAKVEFAPASGRREYTADANGQIKLKLEKTLLAEDPEVRLSEKPQQIVLDIK